MIESTYKAIGGPEHVLYVFPMIFFQKVICSDALDARSINIDCVCVKSTPGRPGGDGNYLKRVDRTRITATKLNRRSDGSYFWPVVSDELLMTFG